MLSPADLADLSVGTALVVADLRAPADDATLRRAGAAVTRYAGPVVGVVDGALPEALDELAGCLTTTLVTGPATARSTVQVSDLASTVAALRSVVASNPNAAATLVGLLRTTAALPVVEGLVAESLAYSMLLGGPEFAAWRAARPRRTPPEETEPVVRVERHGDLLEVALHRPSRHNAFSRAVRDELIEALLLAEVDDSIVAVDLRGDGPSFCSGGDLDEFGTAQDLAAAHLVRITQSAGAAVHRLRAKVTAHLHGACIGAGIEVPAFADHVIAGADTRIQLPELSMGLVPGAGGTVSVTHRCGRWRTAYLVLTGATIDPVTALHWGLVDELSST